MWSTLILFADNNMLFARVNAHETYNLLQILQTNQKALGQMVSLEKLKVSHSRNIQQIEKTIICEKIWVKAMTNHTSYLGLLVLFGRKKNKVFPQIKERIWKKIKGWNEKCLSRVGKKTITKQFFKLSQTTLWIVINFLGLLW